MYIITDGMKKERVFGERLVRAGLITESQLEEALRLQRETQRRLADVLVQLGFLTKEALEEHLKEDESVPKRLGELLLEAGQITEEQLLDALRVQQVESVRIGEALARLGYITQDTVHRVVAKQLGMPMIDLRGFVPPSALMRLLPRDFMEQNCVLPVRRDVGGLVLAVADPMDTTSVGAARYLTGLEIRAVYAPRVAIERAIRRYFHPEEAEESPELMGLSDTVLCEALLDILEQKGILSRAEIMEKAKELARQAESS